MIHSIRSSRVDAHRDSVILAKDTLFEKHILIALNMYIDHIKDAMGRKEICLILYKTKARKANTTSHRQMSPTQPAQDVHILTYAKLWETSQYTH